MKRTSRRGIRGAGQVSREDDARAAAGRVGLGNGGQERHVACQVLEMVGVERRIDDAQAALGRVVFEFALAQQALRRIAASLAA